MISTPELSLQEYRVLLRNDFVTYIERAFYELNPHADFITGQYIDMMAATLEKCRTGADETVDPQSAAAHPEIASASVALPAWLLGHDPAKQIICASYRPLPWCPRFA